MKQEQPIHWLKQNRGKKPKPEESDSASEKACN